MFIANASLAVSFVVRQVFADALQCLLGFLLCISATVFWLKVDQFCQRAANVHTKPRHCCNSFNIVQPNWHLHLQQQWRANIRTTVWVKKSRSPKLFAIFSLLVNRGNWKFSQSFPTTFLVLHVHQFWSIYLNVCINLTLLLVRPLNFNNSIQLMTKFTNFKLICFVNCHIFCLKCPP